MLRIICIFVIWIGWSSYQSIRGKSIAPSIFSMIDLNKSIDVMTKKLTTEEFVAKARKIHFDKIDFSKVVYVNAHTKVLLKCNICGKEWFATPNSILNGSGCPICFRFKPICGVGINDVNLPTRIDNIRDKAYQHWKSLLERCYSDKYQNRQLSYQGCTACEEWKRFSNFKSWFDKNYVDGYQLDKDVLFKGNKLYSPETCCFLPRELNASFQNARINENNGIRKTKKGYSVTVNMYNKKVHVGTFDDIETARNVYVKTKRDYAYELADKYFLQGNISKKIYDAILNYF